MVSHLWSVPTNNLLYSLVVYTAELQTLCMDQWFLVDRGTGSGTFSIFYALLAGLSDQDIQRYYLVDKYRFVALSHRFCCIVTVCWQQCCLN